MNFLVRTDSFGVVCFASLSSVVVPLSKMVEMEKNKL
jgi:hypothetical protein